MHSRKKVWVFGGLSILFLTCCVCLILAIGGTSLFSVFTTARVYPAVVTVQVRPAGSPVLPHSTDILPTGTLVEQNDSETNEMPLSSPTTPVQFDIRVETLQTLIDTVIPINDRLELAARLEGKTDIPSTVDPPDIPYQVGDRRYFWVTNLDTDENTQVEARLEYITEHMYFWVENGLGYDRRDLAQLAEAFEQKIYPTNHDFFGSEWSPGVDGDIRLYILYTRNLGSRLAGYFSSEDEYPPLVHEFSNAVELFLLNADNVKLDERFTYAVLAHEFQHMIHWYQDRNEDSWLNEGFSELAAFINGYYQSGFDWAYIENPDLQLNDWPNDPDRTTPHYGSAFLFVMYFMERFGTEATQMIIKDDENGLMSIDHTLLALGVEDPQTGQQISADDVFMDWVITNYLQDESIGDGRYAYRLYRDMPVPDRTEIVEDCPISAQERSVSQYGVDYISISCTGDYTLKFQGAHEVSILPEDPHSGNYAFWSNKGDEADMTLTRAFDFSAVNGPLTLAYWTWFDLEENYDYLYLAASTDGKTWDILPTPSGTDQNPSGNNWGWAYNGLSGGSSEPVWVQEKVDISQYAGEQVLIRFEYITDAAVNGEGFLLDDVAIPEISYTSDFEHDDGGWMASGWARIQNSLPQFFRLAVIDQGDQSLVEYVEVPESNLVEIPFRNDKQGDEVIIVVTGTTQFTRQKAIYQFEVSP